ncbi:hypothetical protein SAMN04487995_1493 [Dyadobacter koreensis]|uniref:Uncharacterized protein n=1 Tax=Dyadobacter koreensis TaxID=408657 RepID=A0A1H6S522_9BACT|nr:hypothetical protein [Dyadobacter koreensis]SEI58512.1 hypothetical protein SAMN04487995_1493 [Dyadobacter koreensis]
MKKGFKIVEMPGQKCRKVAEIKQQGHRTANLKRYETPDKNLTVRFFCNISSAFFSSQNEFQSSDYILTKLLGGNDVVSPDQELLSSFNYKLQKAARINFAGLTHLLVKSNNEHLVTDVKKEILTDRLVAGESAIKSKKQIKWLSI